MASESAITLVCNKCGKTWRARKAVVTKRRQCPKCYSRNLDEVYTMVNTAATTESDREQPPIQNVGSMSLQDDPEIKKKIKELELAKLDKQIQEIRGGLTNDRVKERLLIKYISLVIELGNSGTLDMRVCDRLVSECPWCGAERENGLAYEEFPKEHPGMTGYRCASCGYWVPY